MTYHYAWACSRCGARDPNPGCHVCAVDVVVEPDMDDDGWEPTTDGGPEESLDGGTPDMPL